LKVQTKLPLVAAAILGSLTTLAAVQLLDSTNTVAQVSQEPLIKSSNSVVDCVPATKTVADLLNSQSPNSSSSVQVLPAADDVEQTKPVSTATPKPAEPNKANDISPAEQHEQLVQHIVVPHVTNLAMVLQLADEQKQQVHALLQEKADADFANWQQVQQQLQAGVGNSAELAVHFQQSVQQSSAQYAAQLRKTLSPTQFEQYTQYESTLLDMRKQQQVSQFNSRLTQLSNLDEFQRQEISRLTPVVFKTPPEIQLGAVASPYAPSMIETDPDALQQLRAVLTESQLKESGWQE
jgi:hypothetical protein